VQLQNNQIDIPVTFCYVTRIGLVYIVN